MPLDYRLLSAVQDLYDLYTRLSPAGPYRLALFHDLDAAAQSRDAAEGRPAIAPELLAAAPQIDLRIRAVSCLLANHLAPAARPLIHELCSLVVELWARLHGVAVRPDYFGYLLAELRRRPSVLDESAPALLEAQTSLAYRMFGEVLAIYLDLLCDAQPGLAAEASPKVKVLREALLASAVQPPP